jgi:RNA polymerase sigma factor (sigma-70 family)
MPSRPTVPALQHLCQAVRPSSKSSVPDAVLLDRFLTLRDEAAFELLVWRHGPLVLGVCSRLLDQAADIEDAFQATFLTLLRKSGQIGKRPSVGSWLYKVAYRISLRVRSRAERRAAHERSLVALSVEPQASDQDQAMWRDLRPLLDAEIVRLPERFRMPFILCCLEGKTNSEAARQLGCPRGTIDSRLARARERLRDRLARHGVVVGSFALTALLAEQSTRLAEVSPVLVHGTVQAALLWSLHGLAGVGTTSAAIADLLAAEVRRSWRKWHLLVGACMLLALAGTSLSVYAHGMSGPSGPGGPGCHSQGGGANP